MHKSRDRRVCSNNKRTLPSCGSVWWRTGKRALCMKCTPSMMCTLCWMQAWFVNGERRRQRVCINVCIHSKGITCTDLDHLLHIVRVTPDGLLHEYVLCGRLDTWLRELCHPSDGGP